MESNEGTFALKKNLINVFSQLPDDKAAGLIKLILQFANNEDAITEDYILNLLFDPIKKDLIKDKAFKAKCSEAGKKSAALKKEQKSTSVQGKVKVRSRSGQGTVNVQSTSVQGIVEVPKNPEIDFQLIFDTYKIFCPELPKPILNEDKKKKIATLLKTYTLDQMGAVFKNAGESDFLSGRKTAWRANFNWLITPNNFVKVLEGNYNNITIVEEQFVDRVQKTSDAVDKFYEINGH